MTGINWVSLDGRKVGKVFGPSSFSVDWEEKELGEKKDIFTLRRLNNEKL